MVVYVGFAFHMFFSTFGSGVWLWSLSEELKRIVSLLMKKRKEKARESSKLTATTFAYIPSMWKMKHPSTKEYFRGWCPLLGIFRPRGRVFEINGVMLLMLKSRWRMADMCCCHFEILHSKVDNPNPSPNHPDGFVTQKKKRRVSDYCKCFTSSVTWVSCISRNGR